jgi:hypothetical protein
MELEGVIAHDDGVTRVASTHIPDDQFGFAFQQVGDLALAFVAPLGSDHNYGRHPTTPSRTRKD